MSHGYGLSVTPLQLAHAYATIGAFGIARPVSFLRVEGAVPGEHALAAQVCRELVSMLESVVAAEGTGKLAAIPGYRVSGKTGTAWKATAGGYSTDRYMAVFGGVAPASEPRLAAVVVIDEPGAGLHMGGQVAAPAFSRAPGGTARPGRRPRNCPPARSSPRCRSLASAPASSRTASSARPHSSSRSRASPAPTARPPVRGCWRRRCSIAAAGARISARSA